MRNLNFAEGMDEAVPSYQSRRFPASNPQGGSPWRPDHQMMSGKYGVETPMPSGRPRGEQKFAAESAPRGGFDIPTELTYTPARRWMPSYDPENPQIDALPDDPILRDAAADLNAAAPPGERAAFVNPVEEDLLQAVGGGEVDPLFMAADALNQAAPPGERRAFVAPAEEEMLIAAGGTGEPAAGGIPSFKKGDVEAPPPRDYYDEIFSTLKAQGDLAPWLYDLERAFRPGYADLERRIQLEQFGLDTDMGLLEAYETGIAPSIARQKREAARTDIAALRELGPELVAAQRDVDPLAESIRQGIMTTARDELAAEGGLTEREARETRERIGGQMARRGLTGQNIANYTELAGLLAGDRQVRGQRMQQAASAYGMGALNPLYALPGRQATVPGQVGQQCGTGSFALESSPALFNPESPYAGNLATQNWQGDMDARTASAANRSAMTGGLFKGLGSVVGGMATGGTGFFRA